MFKLSYQAFILYGISAGYIVSRLIDAGKKTLSTFLAGTGMLLLCAMNIVYLFNAVPAYYGNREYQTLNGIAYLEKKATAENEEGETVSPILDAIEWIRENTETDDVILEVYGNSYTETCYYSMVTGRQTVVGWQTHEWLWRNSYPFVKERQDEIDAIYKGEDPEAVAALLEKYGVDYIIVGNEEYTKYGSKLNLQGLLTLSEMVFKEGSVRILKVNR